MKKTYLSNPAPGESLLSGNLVMETGCGARAEPRRPGWQPGRGPRGAPPDRWPWYIYIYIYIHAHIYIYIYMYVYLAGQCYGGRLAGGESGRPAADPGFRRRRGADSGGLACRCPFLRATMEQESAININSY